MNDTIAAGLQRIIFEAVRDALKEQPTPVLQHETPADSKPERGLPAIMSPAQLAAVLDVSIRTLERWRERDSGPAFRHPEGTHFYRYMREDVMEWLGGPGRPAED